MSRENVELVRAIFEVFNRSGPEAMVPYLDRNVEWHDFADQPDATVHHGHQGFREAASNFMAPWQEFRFEVLELIGQGDEVVVVARMHGRGKGGVDFPPREAGAVITVRDGKVVRFRAWPGREKVLEAAALAPSPRPSLRPTQP